MKQQLIASLSLVLLSGCESMRTPVTAAPDAGPRQAPPIRPEDAARTVSNFLDALAAQDRARISETISATSICDALQRTGQPCVGPEHKTHFRDALVTELLRDDWRAGYADASVSRAETSGAEAATVTLRLASGVDRRFDIRTVDGKPRIVRVY